MNNIKFPKILAACILMLTAACSSTTRDADGSIADPLEGLNRATYSFNKVTDKALIRPFTSAYRTVVPEVPRQGVSNVVRNLREPWTFVNDILQLKFKRAGTTLGRLIVNSTLGIGGLFNVSDDVGIKHHSEDFGQTLAVWGVGDSPYIVLPFIGPSNGRDAIGFGAFVFGDPVTLGISELEVNGLNLTRTGVDALDARSRVHDTINSLYDDENGYDLMRSAYRQNRRYEIHDGNPPEEDSMLFDDLEDEE